MTVHPRRAEDDRAVAQIIRELAPGWVTSERGIRHRRLTTPERARRAEWVCEADGEVVGRASAGLRLGLDRGDMAGVSVMVRPAWRGRGFGSALYDQAYAHAVGLAARRLLSEGPDEPPGRRFAERLGFHHPMTGRLSRVDPRAVDPSALPALRAEKEAEGFEPADEPLTQLPLDEWLARNWGDPDLAHDGSFVVVHDGRPVAETELIVDAAGRRARNGFTGTLRAYRGRGLARLAKLASIAWAAEQELDTIVTDNDETNAAMLAINTRLGYRPFATWLSYVGDLD